MKNIFLGLLFIWLSTVARAGNFYIAPHFDYGKSAGPTILSRPYEFEIYHLFMNTDNLTFLRVGTQVYYEQKGFPGQQAYRSVRSSQIGSLMVESRI